MPVLKPLLPLFLLSAAVSHLFAQTYGKITGAITDASGAVVEGARVSVRNTATSQVREALTNQTGVYDVPFLVPGAYVVRVEKQGFKSATRSDVLLQVGDVARVDFTVDVGVVTESVEVQGGSALLTTETTLREDGHREPAHRGAAARRPQLSARWWPSARTSRPSRDWAEKPRRARAVSGLRNRSLSPEHERSSTITIRQKNIFYAAAFGCRICASRVTRHCSNHHNSVKEKHMRLK